MSMTQSVITTLPWETLRKKWNPAVPKLQTVLVFVCSPLTFRVGHIDACLKSRCTSERAKEIKNVPSAVKALPNKPSAMSLELTEGSLFHRILLAFPLHPPSHLPPLWSSLPILSQDAGRACPAAIEWKAMWVLVAPSGVNTSDSFSPCPPHHRHFHPLRGSVLRGALLTRRWCHLCTERLSCWLLLCYGYTHSDSTRSPNTWLDTLLSSQLQHKHHHFSDLFVFLKCSFSYMLFHHVYICIWLCYLNNLCFLCSLLLHCYSFTSLLKQILFWYFRGIQCLLETMVHSTTQWL